MTRMLLWAFVMVLISSWVSAQTAYLNHLKLVAVWLLTNNTADSMGNFADVTLRNVAIQGADGAYHSGQADTIYLNTPAIPWVLDSFAIQVEFKPEFDSSYRPLLVWGIAWRWLKLSIDSRQYFSTDNILCVDISTMTVNHDSDCVAIPNSQWYKVTLIHIRDSLYLFLNGQKEVVKYVPTDTLNTGSEATSKLFTYDGGAGKTFKGWLRNLRVYNGKGKPPAPTAIQTPASATVSISQLGHAWVVTAQNEQFISSVELWDVTGKLLWRQETRAQRIIVPGSSWKQSHFLKVNFTDGNAQIIRLW